MVNMNKEQFNIGLNDPELPQVVKDASRNHGGMTVPKDFFSEFEKSMNEAIDAQSKVEIIPAPVSKSAALSHKRWAIAAAAVAVIAVIGVAFQFNWVENQLTESQDIMANAVSSVEEELNPSEDIYYTSLSDYEVYDLICGI